MKVLIRIVIVTIKTIVATKRIGIQFLFFIFPPSLMRRKMTKAYDAANTFTYIITYLMEFVNSPFTAFKTILQPFETSSLN